MGFDLPHPLCIRLNPFKGAASVTLERLLADGFQLTPLAVCPGAFLIQGAGQERFSDRACVREGSVYQQAPSSLLPAVVLAPAPGEKVLDACAAPGSKTTQMSVMMDNSGEVLAVEVVKGRFYKLKSVCGLLGADNVRFKLSDMRRLRFPEPVFDRVLVDAPCSSEGRFKTAEPKSMLYWSLRKIKEMSHKQKGILLNASRALKPGGTLVYSTCTFAPEENEEVVDWFLRKTAGEFPLEPFSLPGVPRYPSLAAWNGHPYRQDVSATWRVLPDGTYNGFFLAKFVRTNERA